MFTMWQTIISICASLDRYATYSKPFNSPLSSPDAKINIRLLVSAGAETTPPTRLKCQFLILPPDIALLSLKSIIQNTTK